MATLEKRLEEIRLHNADARKVFEALRGYEKNMTEVTVDTLSSRTGLRPTAIRAVLSELQYLELGELILGRKGHPTRFKWFERFKDVIPGPVKGEPKVGHALGLPQGMAMTQWACKLGGGREAQLLLPANLTQADVQTVRRFMERALGPAT